MSTRTIRYDKKYTNIEEFKADQKTKKALELAKQFPVKKEINAFPRRQNWQVCR